VPRLDVVEYQRRVVDDEVDDLISQLPALVFEGAKAVGKTFTASRRARTVWSLDDPAIRQIAAADLTVLLAGEPPILLDEWHRMPAVWDAVRRAVDDKASPGSFLLTGSARPDAPPTHSGAGRMVTIRMRPQSLMERGLATPTVGLGAMLSGGHPAIEGSCQCRLPEYANEIAASGFPGLRAFTGRALRAQLTGYVARIVDRDFEDEAGRDVRRPDSLRRWLRAYAAATSTTATYNKIRDAATAHNQDAIAKDTAMGYREVLGRLWILEPVPAWQPTFSHIRELAYADKHQLVDPALAIALLGMTPESLLSGAATTVLMPRDGPFLGALFESLVTQSVRVYAQAAEASVKHLRTHRGEHEVDLIVERADGRIVALEVKLSATVEDRDVRHLLWLKESLGDSLLDAAVITTGRHAFRRADGIAVVPAALLGT
jgi:predicted AAA+ superfamily ATPase